MTQFEEVMSLVEATEEKTVQLATDIWNYAEIGFEEKQSVAAFRKALEAEGFVFETGIAGIPTAFTATYQSGEGGVKFGLLAEYDALESLSQTAALPEKKPVVEGGTGHGCGHNLLGTAAVAGGKAISRYLAQGHPGGGGEELSGQS